LRMTGRDEHRLALVEAYCKENMLWHDPGEEPTYSEIVELDLSSVEPSLAGPRRPQDRVPLARSKESFIEALGTFGVDYANDTYDKEVADSFPASDPPSGDGTHEPEEAVGAIATATPASAAVRVELDGEEFELDHGSVVLPALTSCTNTSNPSVMIG